MRLPKNFIQRDGGRKMRYTFRTCFVLSSFISAKGIEGLPLVVAVVVGNEQEYIESSARCYYSTSMYSMPWTFCFFSVFIVFVYCVNYF